MGSGDFKTVICFFLLRLRIAMKIAVMMTAVISSTAKTIVTTTMMMILDGVSIIIYLL